MQIANTNCSNPTRLLRSRFSDEPGKSRFFRKQRLIFLPLILKNFWLPDRPLNALFYLVISKSLFGRLLKLFIILKCSCSAGGCC